MIDQTNGGEAITAGTPAGSPAGRQPRNRVRTFIGGVAVVGFCVGLLVTAIAWLTPFHTGREPGGYDVVATASFFARVFLIPMAVGWAVLAVLAVIGRRRGVAAASLVLAVAWAAPEIWMAWPVAKARTGEPTFAVASFNLNKDLKDATWAATVMRQMNADVVAVQEVSPNAATQIETALADVYPHRLTFPDVGFDGMAVLSKSPLTLLHAPAGYEQRQLTAAVRLNGRDVVLWNVHLSPPQQTAKRRNNRWQVGRMIDDLAGEKGPVVLAGDYNFSAMTANAFALRRAGFRDAQLEAGNGRHASWPAPSARSIVPTVRIDTVYGRGPLQAVGSEVGPDIGSDHRPVKTTWQWTN